jgi:phage terminase large subunit
MSRVYDITIKTNVINQVYMPLLDAFDDRYLVLYGGAGSGKSYYIAQRYLYKMLMQDMVNVMVIRNVHGTHRDSTFALFKQVISKWGMAKYFKMNESDMRVRCVLNGNEIIFKGLDDSEKLKSVTFSKGELTDIWVEEASEIIEADFNQLDIRLRGGKSKKQIVISFNPVDINHWLKKRFFDQHLDNCTVLHTTYKDNKFLDDDYTRLLESYKTSDPYYYSVYCLGEWGVLGKTIFDAQAVQGRITYLRSAKPPRTGHFTYNLIGEQIDIPSIRFIDNPPNSNDSAFICIHHDPKPGHPYVIGGDTSGEGSDFFVADVIDNTTGEQVAVLRHQFDEDLYAKQVFCLGHHYNKAVVAIETNFSTYPNKELERLRYPRLYIRDVIDTFTGQLRKAYGFQTNKVSRPVIIANLVQIVRESVQLIWCVTTLGEMLTFVRNEKGKPEAQAGSHDDCIMALAIAHHARDQQSYQVQGGQAQQVDDDDDNDRDTGSGSWFD